MSNSKKKTSLPWGSKEWKTRLRRSLAQRKRYGANITDVKGLSNWIEENGLKQKQSKNK